MEGSRCLPTRHSVHPPRIADCNLSAYAYASLIPGRDDNLRGFFSSGEEHLHNYGLVGRANLMRCHVKEAAAVTQNDSTVWPPVLYHYLPRQ